MLTETDKRSTTMETNMTTQKALDILERHNLWRMGADYVEATDPKLLGMAIDKAIEVLRLSIVGSSFYCQSDIEGEEICDGQCEHCGEYYKPLEQSTPDCKRKGNSDYYEKNSISPVSGVGIQKP